MNHVTLTHKVTFHVIYASTIQTMYLLCNIGGHYLTIVVLKSNTFLLHILSVFL